MPGNPAIPWAATAVAGGILLASSCSRAPRLDSHWPAASIHVDGADTDWRDRRYVLETLNVTVAVANDSNYLYLCVVTSDRSVQRQVVRRGIELWIDPKGGSKTYFGVRLPGADGEGQNNPRGRGQRDGESPERLARWLGSLTGPREIHIIDSTDDEGWRITPGAGGPVQAQLGFDQGRLVCEARVPLHYRGYPPFELDSPVGLGLRLPVPDRPMGGMSNPRGDFGGGGDGGGFGGAGGRRMGGGRGAGMSMETLEQWIEVELRGL